MNHLNRPITFSSFTTLFVYIIRYRQKCQGKCGKYCNYIWADMYLLYKELRVFGQVYDKINARENDRNNAKGGPFRLGQYPNNEMI